MLATLDIPYTRRLGREIRMDLFRPDAATGPLPVILCVPGGGWARANKGMAPDWLTDHGFAVASIEYSISSVAIAPANIQDCKAAVRWLRAHADEYALDGNHIGAWGGSAGGHLVALLGVTSATSGDGSGGASGGASGGVSVAELEGDGGSADSGGGFSSAVQAVCDFCGPTDLMRMARPEVRSRYPGLYEATANYLGGPVAERAELARLVSPLTYVSSACPPTLIMHGLIDTDVPVEESIAFDQALQRAGVDSVMRILETASHGWDQRQTNAEVAAFFKRTLR